MNLAYANPGKDTWVSVTGVARIVDDMGKRRELFNAMVKAWFPGGPEDPEAELVAVEVDEAEYWDVKSYKLMQLLKMGKAALTGDRPKKMGEHEHVQLG
ncbi:Pyridoxamine 5'-phosphate oxidase like protein [compost metagenome]